MNIASSCACFSFVSYEKLVSRLEDLIIRSKVSSVCIEIYMCVCWLTIEQREIHKREEKRTYLKLQVNQFCRMGISIQLNRNDIYWK